MRLVIAEKPSVARDIARVLKATEKCHGHLAGNGYAVTWAFGHLVAIAAPEEMNPAWNKWALETLPMIPETWRYSLLPDAKRQFEVIRKLLKGADQVIAATDAGREGEHIFRLIYELAGGRALVKRLWISSLTDDAIRQGFERLQDSALFDPLAAAAKARARADWLVGLNCTRAYTLRNNDKCTVGRVQTPTLALVVARHREIQSFKAAPYYEITVALEPAFKARLIHHNKTRIEGLELAKRILQDLEPLSSVTVFSVETKDVRAQPPPLLNLLTLQKEANKRWGYTAAQVLELAQALYEEHKVLSYPRTESRHLSTDMLPGLPGLLDGLGGAYASHAADARQALAAGLQLSKAYVDDAKLTDHHAIIPTHRPLEGLQLTPDQKNLYDLVARRFLAVFFPPKVTAETVALFTAGNYTLRASGSVLKDPGWSVTALPEPAAEPSEASEDQDPPQVLPPLSQGQVVPKLGQELLSKLTRPPRPYTDATLLDAMKNAGGLVDDEDLAAYMKASGLGTAATRAEIIEKLLRTQYLAREKKALVPTAKGVALVDQVHADLRDPALTARWEQRLKVIEDGAEDASHFEADVAQFVRELLPAILQAAPIPKVEGPGLGVCPACSKGRVRPTPRGYGCTRYKEGCHFTIWKHLAGKSLNDKIVTELLEHRTTKKPIKGFTSKAKKPFDARLRLDDNHHIVFVFEPKTPATSW